MLKEDSYRPEIDGIRAIAVLAVIFYHAEMILIGRDWFSGGFMGVDIFFVISGYLISKIVFIEVGTSGRFNFLRFYQRRARRILPTLLLVMLATAPFAYQYLLPEDLVQMAQSQLASLAFASNIFFYLNQTDYGAAPGLLMPFLHTWSLSVEEQFYLALPVIVLLFAGYTGRRWLWVSALLVASLLACLLLNDVDKQLAFFMPLTRAWELLAGTLLALYELHFGRTRHGRTSSLLALVGLSLVLASIVAFNQATPHPGLLTLVPVLGTVLLLAFASPSNFVGRALSWSIVRYAGVISYSLYLWHYPIFALQRTADYNFTNLDKAASIVLTVALSVLSYHFVEQPFRHRVRAIWRPAAGAAATVVLLASVTVLNAGFTFRLNDVVPLSALGREKSEVARFTNFQGGNDDAKPSILILGDSYTTNWSVALSEFVDTDRFDVISVSYLGCDVGISKAEVEVRATSPDYEESCGALRDYVQDSKQIRRVAAVFLTSHRPFEYGVNLFRFDLVRWIQSQSPKAEAFVFGNYYQLDGVRLSSCLNLMFHQKRDASVCLELSTYPPEDFTVELLPLYPSDLDFTYVDFLQLFCGRTRLACEYEWEGVPFMTDWNHLTATFLIRALEVILSKHENQLTRLGLDKFLQSKA
jgi:peptidoglycan/LPS O-acetylase OafA/YrhL